MSVNKYLANRIHNFVKAYNKYAVGTAQAEKMGYRNFKEGSRGREKRDEIAEAIEREAHKKGKKVDKKGNISKSNSFKPKLPYNGGNLSQMKKGFNTSNFPHEGTAKYKPEFERRKSMNNKLGPYMTTEGQLRSKINPNPRSSNIEGLSPEVELRTNRDKSKIFRHKGKLYDASKMSLDEIESLLEEIG